ncbi:MAG: FAD-dependent oxidoreductase [Balneola sp.]|jgi:pyruvate/2-oxoglutarate dehydrogenase complex dihydrolipoamide dehydrogenase (E3) component
MAEFLEMAKDWFLSLGEEYGVNPLIFGSIYVGAIPFFTLSLGWLVKNYRKGKNIAIPALSTTFFFISAYLYLIVAGKNVPWWVYGVVILLVAGGAYSTVKKIRSRVSDSESEGTGSFEFDSVVIGGGAAGLTASGICANFGAKTMMIEKHKLGGDCTWTGCVPSKVLLKAGKVAQQVRDAGKYGLIDGEPKIDFKKVIKHVDDIRKEVYEDADRPEIFEDMGIEVVEGEASFLNAHTIEIKLPGGEKRKVTSRFFFIAAGGSAFIPPIEGIDTVDYLTNDSLFEIEDLPEELLIIGGGPIGTEMSQAFANLGSKVTVIDMADGIMMNDDPELTDILFEELKRQGVNYELGASVKSVSLNNGKVSVHIEIEGEEKTITGDKLLMATGRKPNLNGLGLDKAGVEYTKKGIAINNSCRTNKKNIYAIGDIASKYQFTHMSEHMAKIATSRAMLKIPMKMDLKHITWATFTSPEIAHVGATEKELNEKGEKFEVYRFPYSKIDRAVTEGESVGMIKIFAKKFSGKILGASVVGAHAGEFISEYAVAMKNGVSLRNIADTIHPYPSWGLGARRAADQWYIKNQSAGTVKWIKRIFGYKGEIPDYSDPDRVV